MARYIDAERIDFSPLEDDFDRARAKVIIMGQPTADVVEVRNGEWESKWSILANAIYFNCSLCGESDPWQGTGRGRAKYCPNCGAKMDGGKAE